MEKLLGLLPYIVLYGAIGTVVYLTYRNNKKKYLAIPTLAEYLKKFPKAKTNHGIRCGHCNGKSLKNWGIVGPDDYRRKVSCNSCGETLYRLEQK